MTTPEDDLFRSRFEGTAAIFFETSKQATTRQEETASYRARELP